MNNERLSDLGVLSVVSKRAKALDMGEFIPTSHCENLLTAGYSA